MGLLWKRQGQHRPSFPTGEDLGMVSWQPVPFLLGAFVDFLHYRSGLCMANFLRHQANEIWWFLGPAELTLRTHETSGTEFVFGNCPCERPCEYISFHWKDMEGCILSVGRKPGNMYSGQNATYLLYSKSSWIVAFSCSTC